jgi:hypothetical protein
LSNNAWRFYFRRKQPFGARVGNCSGSLGMLAFGGAQHRR